MSNEENQENKSESTKIKYTDYGSSTLLFIGICTLIFVSGNKGGLVTAGAFIGAAICEVASAITMLAVSRNKDPKQ